MLFYLPGCPRTPFGAVPVLKIWVLYRAKRGLDMKRAFDEEFIRFLVTPQPYRLFCDDILREFTPKEFVGLVSDLFRQLGCSVMTGPEGADEAIDILCKAPEGDYIVQCKKWKAKVGVATVREVYGAAVKYQAKGAFIVTVGEFTSTAADFLIDLRPPPVRLIDGKELFDLMNQHMPTVVADIQDGLWESHRE